MAMTAKRDKAWEEGSAHGYMLGQVVGLEWAEGWLLERAKERFGAGHDNEARDIRRLSERLKEERIKRRAEFDEKYHPEGL
jgi:hypothetical protein